MVWPNGGNDRGLPALGADQCDNAGTNLPHEFVGQALEVLCRYVFDDAGDDRGAVNILGADLTATARARRRELLADVGQLLFQLTALGAQRFDALGQCSG